MIGGVARTMWGHVDVRSGKLTSPIQVDNYLFGVPSGWLLHRIVLSMECPDGCRPLNYRPVLSCVAAISVPTLKVKARDHPG